ncbi:hypothetical protein D3C85_1080920 [compost metagenome]
MGDSLAVHDLDDAIFDSLEPLAHGQLDPLTFLNFEVANLALRLFSGEVFIHSEYGKCTHGSLQAVEGLLQKLVDGH